MKWMLLTLFPAVLFAQQTFGPLRLDDQLDENFYYASLTPWPDGNLLCTWASTSDDRLAGVGQRISPAGELIGEQIPYEVATPIPLVCPAKLTITRLPDGRETDLLHHS